MGISLQAKKRDNFSRATTKQIRREGFIPAVVYGKEKEPQTVSVENIELLKTVRDEGRNAIISLDIENGNSVDVMLHEYQTDPVKGEVIHVDFYVVDMSEEMDVAVTLRLDGDAVGVKDGGILQQPLYELQVRAKPREIPEEIAVDISELAIGDSISVADIPVSDKYELIDDAETTIAVVLPPESETESEEDVDFSAEPELVGAEDEEE
ncbi:50S ribosomal protein L25/general stress protein Ctc [Pseudogracilibacillus auburnensis]|uniref:Large ribosomal subunit protein bL25 n=1 Tax=Pseudogracilibacillus auburnensis TaxID=1494959 RepID=A0A2V3VY98_9BACI|nr:50S ribosomal protein L25/general stress protein Ctc [Pseudogracilibacillus auburnensis]MBO1004456.1 50S ribosomal protein L25/general stress protein Ctc [Pseudogracilibacillus auburnensis]PXW81549.1 LSU ribosomal protein L25P [Pseudogracilibacillus auburnensis]